jgi:hypothetical protein
MTFIVGQDGIVVSRGLSETTNDVPPPRAVVLR